MTISTNLSGERTRASRLADPVYVHAKIGVIDDSWLTLGSANLNEHSLFNDTEMNLVLHDPELAVATAADSWAEHLELPIEQIPSDPIEAIDELWKPISKEQLQRRLDRQPLTHRLVRLPHVSRRSSLGPRARQRPPRRRLTAGAPIADDRVSSGPRFECDLPRGR